VVPPSLANVLPAQNVIIAELRRISPNAPGQVQHFLAGETLQPLSFTLLTEDKCLLIPFQAVLYLRIIKNFHFIF
jgi:hypothetical protein